MRDLLGAALLVAVGILYMTGITSAPHGDESADAASMESTVEVTAVSTAHLTVPENRI